MFSYQIGNGKRINDTESIENICQIINSDEYSSFLGGGSNVKDSEGMNDDKNKLSNEYDDYNNYINDSLDTRTNRDNQLNDYCTKASYDIENINDIDIHSESDISSKDNMLISNANKSVNLSEFSFVKPEDELCSSIYWEEENKKRVVKKKNKETKKKFEKKNIKTKLANKRSKKKYMSNNIDEIEKAIFNIRNDSVNDDKILNLPHKNDTLSKVVRCNDLSSVPSEILDDIKNYNDLRLEEFQHKMTDRKSKQKANKRVSAIQDTVDTDPHSFYSLKQGTSPIVKSKFGENNYGDNLDFYSVNEFNKKEIDIINGEKITNNNTKKESKNYESEYTDNSIVSNDFTEENTDSIVMEANHKKELLNGSNYHSEHDEYSEDKSNIYKESDISSTNKMIDENRDDSKILNINQYHSLVSSTPLDKEEEETLSYIDDNKNRYEIRLLENYAEQDYQKRVNNFQEWLQKKEKDRKKKLKSTKTKRNGKNYSSSIKSPTTPYETFQDKISYDMSSPIHTTINTKKTKERQEKNEEVYKNWLNNKISQEKEKKNMAMSEKLQKLENEKKEILEKSIKEKKNKEKLDEWMKMKNEEEQKKKKEMETTLKEKELLKEQKKQMDEENFKAWCQKKEHEKHKHQGKNHQEIQQIAIREKEWIDPNAPEEIPSDVIQSNSTKSSKNSLYKERSISKSKSINKSKSKSKGLYSTVSMIDSVNGGGGLIINYKDSALFTESEKQLFSNNGKKSRKKKKSKNKKKNANEDVTGSYCEGIYGDYEKKENRGSNSSNAFSSMSSTTINTTSRITPKHTNSHKNINAPPSLFNDYKKYENYPDFKRKYPLLIGNAGLEMLLLEQNELKKEEKERGIPPSKSALVNQVIQITGRKDDAMVNNKNNITFSIDNNNPENPNGSTTDPTSGSSIKKTDTGNHGNPTSYRGNSIPLTKRNSIVSVKRASVSRRKSSSHIQVPKPKTIQDLINPSLLKFLMENQNLDYHEMCKTIRTKVLEDHVQSILSNYDDGKSQQERDEELLNSSYHTTRQRLSDLFQNKLYLENLLKTLSSNQEQK